MREMKLVTLVHWYKPVVQHVYQIDIIDHIRDACILHFCHSSPPLLPLVFKLQLPVLHGTC